jgi:hypothetical protein
MGDPIDPDKLVSLPDLAKEFGYARTHVSKLAATGKIKAWLVGHSWVTTRDLFEQYVRTNPKAGRPKAKPAQKKRPK